MAIAVGPIAGGLITQHFGWERAFYVNPYHRSGDDRADPDLGRRVRGILTPRVSIFRAS